MTRTQGGYNIDKYTCGVYAEKYNLPYPASRCRNNQVLQRVLSQLNSPEVSLHGSVEEKKSNEIELDEDDLNEGFCHYSIVNDDE